MRKKIAAGNWKLNTTLEEGKKLIKDILSNIESTPPAEKPGELEVVFGTPFITLAAAAEMVSKNPMVHIAAQNCADKEKGAYTGETSVDMIKSTGAEYVIIGHSERRQYYNETDAILAEKVNLALSRDLTPIFCCGEQLEIREAGNHVTLVKNQIENGLFHLNEDQISKVVIAYEPVWAIGTGVTASPEQAQEMHAEIRKVIASKYGEKLAESISILYGGSVNAKNAKELFSQKDVDGGLVGGASLKPDEFSTIIRSF